MSKKILFMSSAKLTAICFGLLLAVFCTIGMSFTPATDDNLADPNDSTNVSGPRRSHYYEKGTCDDTQHYKKDYAVAKVTTIGNGTVSISSPSGGGLVTDPSSYTNGTVLTSGSDANSSVSISWNCNHEEASSATAVTATAAMHKRKFTITANARANYYFAGWSTSSSENDIFEKSNPYTYEQVIDDWNKNSGSHESTGNALTTTYYAIFKAETMATITFAVPENGSYTYSTEDVSATTVSSTTGQKTLTTKKTVTFTATAASGYKFFGWYKGSDSPENYLGYTSPLELGFDADATVCAKFIKSDAAIFALKGKEDVQYHDLNQAISAASSGSNKVVVPTISGSVSAGTYTIPSGVTLLVPYDVAYTCRKQLKNGYNYETYASSWSAPSVYRTLTLADGAHIIVNGDISVSAVMCWAMGYNGSPCGKYGLLKMNSGSTITLNSGSNLYAWGYIAGEGIITAKSGSNTYEGFQVTGYRGGNATSGMAGNSYKVFPMNQYYIQNIENKIVFQAGALEHLFMGVTSSWGDEGASIDFVGGPTSQNTLFRLQNGATLTKWYDASKDRQKYELAGNAVLDQIVLDIADVSSKDYVLPLTNNMDLDIKSGTTTINYDVAIFPDVNIHIYQGATIDIKANAYIYDADEWLPAYAYAKIAKNNDKNTQGAVTFANVVRPITYTTTTKYSRTSVTDANIIVDGTLSMSSGAKLFTTISGANISGTGTVYMASVNNANASTYQAVQSTTGSGNTIHHYDAITVTPAKLHNASQWYSAPYIGEGKACEYLATSGATAGTTITYANGHWGWMEIWKDEKGTVLKAINTCTQQYGTAPSYPSDPCKNYTGWNTETSTPNQEVVHTPIYTAKTFAITYSAGTYGNGTVAGGTKTCGEGYTLSSYTFTREGHIQTGWSTTDGGNKAYDLGDSYTVDETITLYPYWTPAVANVTINDVTTPYLFIQDAFDAANEADNAIITMLQSTSATSEISITKAMTIDLNGKEITSTEAAATAVFKITSGEVTIHDNGAGMINHTAEDVSGHLYGINITGGSLNLVGVHVYAKNNKVGTSSSHRAYGINAEVPITISSSTIEAWCPNNTHAFGICANGGLTIGNSTVIAKSTNSARGIYTKETNEFSNVSITATATTGVNSYAIFAKSGELNIHSGTYTATAADGETTSYAIHQEGGKVSINGGRFSGTTKELDKQSGTINLYGGVYVHEDDLATYVKSPYRKKPLPETHPEHANGYRYTVDNLYTVTWRVDGQADETTEVAYNASPEYPHGIPEKEMTKENIFTFEGWSNGTTTFGKNEPLPSVTGQATYTAQFQNHIRKYPVMWKNFNGNEVVVMKETMHNYGWNDVPAANTYDGVTPTRLPDHGKTYTFNGWSDPESQVAGGDVTYTAQYLMAAIATANQDVQVTAGGEVTEVAVGGENSKLTIGDNDNHIAVTTTVTVVENGGELVVSNGSSIGKENPSDESIVIVESGGQLNVAEGGSVAADVFIIQATTEDQEVTPGSPQEEVQISGELTESGSKTLREIYYDLTRQHGKVPFLARVWYAVAVPWAVDVPNYDNGGVFIKRGEEFIPQRLGATFDLLSYDGNCRAQNGAGANCWVYLEDEIVEAEQQRVMTPGKLYMIYLTEETYTIRFKKKVGEAIHTNSLTVSAHNETSNTNDANWNGIANPATYNAYMNVSVGGVVQKFVPGTQPRDPGRYMALDLNDKQAVGQPFFVQVDPSVGTEASVVVTRTNPSSAPRRAQAEDGQEARYAVGIAANGKLADRLYIQTAEEKEDKYVIGKDMSKMSVSSYVAQMWVERYGTKLCQNTMALTRDKAVYPLGIYAPQAGEYMIFAPTDIASGDNIYLTYDGRVIWNLTMAPYYASLEKGTTTHYGLRLVHSNAPAVVTDIDEVHGDNTQQCTKVIMDDCVYILRGEELYTITGQKAQ